MQVGEQAGQLTAGYFAPLVDEEPREERVIEGPAGIVGGFSVQRLCIAEQIKATFEYRHPDGQLGVGASQAGLGLAAVDFDLGEPLLDLALWQGARHGKVE